MKAPKCSGEVKPPEMSAECKANCDAEVTAKMECRPATVMVKIDGAADAQAAAKLKGALTPNLPALLKVTMGMKGKIEGVVKNVEASIKGVEAAVQGGGDAAMKVGACFVGSLEGPGRGVGADRRVGEGERVGERLGERGLSLLALQTHFRRGRPTCRVFFGGGGGGGVRRGRRIVRCRDEHGCGSGPVVEGRADRGDRLVDVVPFGPEAEDAHPDGELSLEDGAREDARPLEFTASSSALASPFRGRNTRSSAGVRRGSRSLVARELAMRVRGEIEFLVEGLTERGGAVQAQRQPNAQAGGNLRDISNDRFMAFGSASSNVTSRKYAAFFRTRA